MKPAKDWIKATFTREGKCKDCGRVIGIGDSGYHNGIEPSIRCPRCHENAKFNERDTTNVIATVEELFEQGFDCCTVDAKVTDEHIQQLEKKGIKATRKDDGRTKFEKVR